MFRAAILLLMGIVCGEMLADDVTLRTWLLVLAAMLGVALVTKDRFPVVCSIALLACTLSIGAIRIGFEDNCIEKENTIQTEGVELRERIVNRLSPPQTGNNGLAIAAAMALGDKSRISKETRNTYNIAGASHILALSGMHLAIIYFILMSIIGRRRRWWRVSVLFLIWAYVVTTGMPVSLVRAALMLSIWQILDIVCREQHPLNVIGLTATIIMMVSPLCVWDIGFQLSFMSVMAIVTLMPHINSAVPRMLQEPQRRHDTPLDRQEMWLRAVGRSVWSACGVSIAAQLGCLPLVLHYFGRFSSYFLITNLVAVPLATVIITLMVAFIVLCLIEMAGVSFIGGCIDIMREVIGWFASFMNNTMELIAALPGASIEKMYINAIQVALMYIIIIVTILLVRRFAFRMPTSTLYRPEPD